MEKGDEVLFYHSGEEKAVVGIARVTKVAYPDPTAKEGDWNAVDLTPIRAVPRSVTLAEIKATRSLQKLPLIRLSRLSVMPVAEPDFRKIIEMASRADR
jgi:predicted RNA-binding protein with PUA-like domain